MGILNERIKNRRQQLGYTLLYIAEQLGVKEATVQRYESGDIKNIKHSQLIVPGSHMSVISFCIFM